MGETVDMERVSEDSFTWKPPDQYSPQDSNPFDLKPNRMPYAASMDEIQRPNYLPHLYLVLAAQPRRRP